MQMTQPFLALLRGMMRRTNPTAAPGAKVQPPRQREQAVKALLPWRTSLPGLPLSQHIEVFAYTKSEARAQIKAVLVKRDALAHGGRLPVGTVVTRG